MVFIATFNNISVISWQSVLLVEETRVPGKKTTNLKQVFNKLNVASSTPNHEQNSNSTLVVIGNNCTGSCKSKPPYDHDNDSPCCNPQRLCDVKILEELILVYTCTYIVYLNLFFHNIYKN
jgi:hypothetical protein